MCIMLNGYILGTDAAAGAVLCCAEPWLDE
jgi:hypothetical protein